jgi:hypothetical protein
MKQTKTYDEFLRGLFGDIEGIVARPAPLPQGSALSGLVTRPAQLPQGTDMSGLAEMFGSKMAPQQMAAGRGKMIQPMPLPREEDLQQILGMNVGAAPSLPKAGRPKLFGKKYIG